MKADLFKDLNERQAEAVRSTEGRVRVVAGAGAGKTKTLASRYAFLVNALGIDPANILCLTFTNKAAKEMTTRIAQLVSSGNYNDFVCTIHGFCVKFLRKEIYRLGFPKTFTILDTEDQKQMAHQVMEQLGIDKSKSSLASFLSEMASRKSSGEYVERYMTPQSAKIDSEYCRESFPLYLAIQLKLFALDFDDLIHFTIHILHTFPDVMKHWQEELNYIMVDEAQDCNPTDWHLIETLGAAHGNVFIVGDPDQAIYEWRGSDPGYFIRFAADKDVILDENYRSTPGILDAANSVIRHNKNRIDKDLYTRLAAGAQITHYHAASEADEATWITHQIKSRIESGAAKASDFAVLYRASYLSRFIEQSLLKHGIQYSIWGGIRFFERKEIKDAVSYLRLVSSDEDDLSFLRICNVPSRKIGKTTISSLRSLAQKDDTPLMTALRNHRHEKPFDKEPIQLFIDLIDQMRQQATFCNISVLLEELLKASGLKEEIRLDGDDERLQNLLELSSSIKYYEESRGGEPTSLTDYLQDIALYTNADYKKNTDTVKLMTIHQAKGLEFPHVFVVGLSEGIFPSTKSIRERKELAEEEERRLMYVAITRARQTLFLTESEGFNSATSTEKYPSRFLLEIKRNLFVTEGKMDPELWENTKRLAGGIESMAAAAKGDELNVGDEVEHEIFGKGKVVEILRERQSVKVEFGDGIGCRTIRATFVKLIGSDTDSSTILS